MSSSPIVFGEPEAVAPGATIAISNIFEYVAVGSIAGFTIEQTTSNGGYLLDNGTIEPSGTLFSNGSTLGIPIADIGQWSFVAGSTGSSDSLALTIIESDGTENSPSATDTVSVNAPPSVIAEPTATLATGNLVPVSGLFGIVPSPIMSSVVGFEIELTNNDGYLTNNGTIEPSGTLLNGGNPTTGIPYNEISQWDYVPGKLGTTGTIELTAIEAGGVAGSGSASVTAGPLAITAGAIGTFVAGAAPATLDNTLNFGTTQADGFFGATISISAGFLPGDILNVGSAQAGITSSYDASTGALTLTGSASVAAYQTELDSVTYAFSPGDPTNGGSDTSRTITWTANDGAGTGSATSTLTVNFESEPSNDITLQNTGGQVALWQVNGTTLTAYGVIGPNPGPSWFAMGTGAFFTGDTSDVIFQNQNGAVAVWQVNGTTLGQFGLVQYNGTSVNPGTAWQIKAPGDLYNLGSNNAIVLQNANGAVGIWEMTNGTTISQATLVQYSGATTNPGSAWQVEATGDFYSDGNNGIVLQNASGAVAIWEMANGNTITQANLTQYEGTAANPGPSWHVEGTGAFFGGDSSDIVLQNSNGEVAIWEMNGGTITQSALVQYDGATANPGSSWHVVSTDALSNAGTSDIVLQNTNGEVAVWEMSGSTITSVGVVANPGTSWSVIDNTMRFIYSTAANETLAATLTTPDEFVFTSFAAGTHTISGFDPGQDIIAFRSSEFGSFGAVQAATSAIAGGAMINLGNSSSLLLPGVDPTTLHARNFALG